VDKNTLHRAVSLRQMQRNFVYMRLMAVEFFDRGLHRRRLAIWILLK